MGKPVLGIGLDAADPILLEKWMAQGYLPNLDRLRRHGIYGRLDNQVHYEGGATAFSSTEPLWVMFSSGVYPHKTGFWDTVVFNPDRYQVECDPIHGGYHYQEYQPFYALGDDYKVALFDIPVSTLSHDINGLQILGWGGHFPFVPSGSQPPELFPEIVATYGQNPILHRDNGKWWNEKYVDWIQSALRQSISKRVEICQDLLRRDSWDLFLTTFGDSHSAGHDLYDQSQPDHPLHHFRRKRRKGLTDPLLQTYQDLDRAVGDLIAAAPPDAHVLCYSMHGMGANHTDLLSMFFMGELLYRFNFPGQVGLAPGQLNSEPSGPIKHPIRGAWCDEVWRTIHQPNPMKRILNHWLPKRYWPAQQYGLTSPKVLNHPDNPLGWMPAMAYASLWPQMRAFALPAFADGHIRINLKGRETLGIVNVAEYDQLCDEITALLFSLKDGRSGRPLVKQVVRTRLNHPLDPDPKLPDADLVVVWHDIPTDVVDSPDLGRIGPVTFNRPGGHRARGFVMAQGPGISAGQTLEGGQVVDLAPTILNLIGAPIPAHFDGKVLFSAKSLIYA